VRLRSRCTIGVDGTVQRVHNPGMTLSQYLEQRGAASKVARALKIQHSTVSRWARNRVPADRVQDVARVTGIPAAELRPDLAQAFGQAS